MKFMKMIALVLTFAMLLGGSAVFANESVDVLPAVVEDGAMERAYVSNGGVVDGVSVVDIEGIWMMPLRQVAEGLGYTVTWNDEAYSIELIKGAQYITMAIGQDAYAFSRRAPQSLGAAPYLYNDCVTYVPVNFVTEIIDGYYTINEDGTYKMVVPVSVTAVTVNEDNLVVKDNITEEEVIVFIDENTEITDGVDALSLADIKADMVLGIEYGPAMTMSLPPQTTAVKIIVENVIVDDEVEAEVVTKEVSGTITEIEDNKVILGDPTVDTDSIALIVSDETVITKGLDRRIYKIDDLTVGTKVTATIGEAATMSIPPQSLAITINIVE